MRRPAGTHIIIRVYMLFGLSFLAPTALATDFVCVSVQKVYTAFGSNSKKINNIGPLFTAANTHAMSDTPKTHSNLICIIIVYVAR